MSAAPLVVEYLRTHSAAELLAEHGVKFAIGTRPYKASLNYDQLLAKDSNPLACECRGLILATPDGSPLPTSGVIGATMVMARPMDRFFNHGAGAAHPLDLAHPDTRIFEKLDGTLCIVYFDDHCGEWCVATRAVCEADRAIDGFGEHTFRTLFEMALAEHLDAGFAEFTRELRSGHTYCFELTTPQNRIVVDNRVSKIHTLAIRSRARGTEYCPTSDADLLLVPPCPSWPLRSLTDLLAFVNSRPPSESEGVVVRLPGFKRVKVRSQAYAAAARMKESVSASPRGLLECILLGQDYDVFPMLPAYMQTAGSKLKDDLAAWVASYDDAYPRLASEAGGDRKTMALAVQRDGFWIAPMMERFGGKCDSTRAWIDRAKRPEGWGDTFLDNLAALVAA